MICLGLDTSGVTLSVGVSSHGKILGERTTSGENPHSVMILSEIGALLHETGLEVKDVSLIAVSGGPGRYTALRVGMATAKGLAFSRGIPLVRVSALEAMAASLLLYEGNIVPVMDARRQLVYFAVFKANGEGMVRSVEDQALSYRDAADMIPDQSILTGDGVSLVLPFLSERGVTFETRPCMIRGGIVANMGETRYAREMRNEIYEGPTYIRKVEVHGMTSHDNLKG